MNLLEALRQRADQERQALAAGRLGMGMDPHEGPSVPLGKVPVAGGPALLALHALGLAMEGGGTYGKQGLGTFGAGLGALRRAQASRYGGAVNALAGTVPVVGAVAGALEAGRHMGALDPTQAGPFKAADSDRALAAFLAHPGFAGQLAANEELAHTNRFASGVGAELANPLNLAGPMAEAGGVLGRLGIAGNVINEAPMLPLRAALIAKRAEQGARLAAVKPIIPALLKGEELPAMAPVLGARAQGAVRDALDRMRATPIDDPRVSTRAGAFVAGNMPKGARRLGPPAQPEMGPTVVRPAPQNMVERLVRAAPQEQVPRLVRAAPQTGVPPVIPPATYQRAEPTFAYGPIAGLQETAQRLGLSQRPSQAPNSLADLLTSARGMGAPEPPPAAPVALARDQILADTVGARSARELTPLFRDLHRAVYGDRSTFAIPAMTGVARRGEFTVDTLLAHPDGNAAPAYLDYLATRVQQDAKAQAALARTNPDLLADIMALDPPTKDVATQKRTIQAMFGAGPFKDDATQAVAAATPEVAGATAAVAGDAQSAFDAILASGDSGRMSGELPAGTAFWEKRLGVSGDEARALLDGAVADGRLGVGPDGALRFKPKPLSTQTLPADVRARIDAAVARGTVTPIPLEPPVVPEPRRIPVAYHGTRANFDQFRDPLAAQGQANDSLGRGIYFTDSPELAAFWSRDNTGNAAGGRVMTGALTMRNPLEFDMQTWRQVQTLVGGDSATIADRVRAAGHDGIIFHQPNGRTTYVVYDPAAIGAANPAHDITTPTPLSNVDIAPEGAPRPSTDEARLREAEAQMAALSDQGVGPFDPRMAAVGNVVGPLRSKLRPPEPTIDGKPAWLVQGLERMAREGKTAADIPEPIPPYVPRPSTVEPLPPPPDQPSAGELLRRYRERWPEGTPVAPEAVPKQETLASSKIANQVPDFAPSKGHVAIVGDYEYFTGPGGNLYRAPVANGLEVGGYRAGGRFEATPTNAERALQIAQGTQQNAIPVNSTGQAGLPGLGPKAPVTPTQARDELFADAADGGVADVAQAGAGIRAQIAALEARLREVPATNLNTTDPLRSHIKYLQDRLATADTPKVVPTVADIEREQALQQQVEHYGAMLGSGKNALGGPINPEYRALWTAQLADMRAELAQLQGIDRAESMYSAFDVRKVGKGYELIHKPTGTPLAQPFKRRGEADTALYNLRNAYQQSKDVRRALGYRASDPTSPEAQQAVQRALAPPTGGDIAAGGGGGGVGLAAPAIGRATEAGVGALAGGAIGGAAGLTQGDTPEERRANALKGAGLGLAVGGNVGYASPELLAAARHLAPLTKGTMLSPAMQARGVRAGQRAQDAAIGATGPRGLGNLAKATEGNWREQAVNTFKQLPQDAVTRWVTLWGLARRELGVADPDIAYWQETLAAARDAGTTPLNNPVVDKLRRMGLQRLLPAEEFQRVYGTDFVTSEGAKAASRPRLTARQSGVAGALFSGYNGTPTVNPVSIAAGAVKGRFQPFISGYVQFLNGVQHDAFRYAMADKTLQRDIPALGRALTDDLAARGVDVTGLVGKGGYFSGEDVAKVAGPALGKQWDQLLENVVRNGGDRVAFLAGDFRDASKYRFEDTAGRVFPFIRWPLHYGPVFAEIAANHPRLAAVGATLLAQQKQAAQQAGLKAYETATVPITTETPVLGAYARLRLGGQAGTVRLNPLGAVVPYSQALGGVDMPEGDDATLYQQAKAIGSTVGLTPNPLIQAGAYVTGQDYQAPGPLSRTAGLEGLAGLLPGDAGTLQVPSLRAGLDTVREKVTGAPPSDYDPVYRHYAELVLDRTGKVLDDQSNRAYLRADTPEAQALFARAKREVLLAGAAGNAQSLTSPVAATARGAGAQAIATAKAALPYDYATIQAASPGAALMMQQANARYVALHPEAGAYTNAGPRGREETLLKIWETRAGALKKANPDAYQRLRRQEQERIRQAAPR